MELFEEAKAINQVVDLDFSNFDIDDNCYVYHINNGKRVVLSEFKTELKLQNAEAPQEPVEQPPPKIDNPKNFGGQDCDIVVDPIPVDLLNREVSYVNLGDKEELVSAERAKT
jgi:hypothetical protein